MSFDLFDAIIRYPHLFLRAQQLRQVFRMHPWLEGKLLGARDSLCISGSVETVVNEGLPSYELQYWVIRPRKQSVMRTIAIPDAQAAESVTWLLSVWQAPAIEAEVRRLQAKKELMRAKRRQKSIHRRMIEAMHAGWPDQGPVD